MIFWNNLFKNFIFSAKSFKETFGESDALGLKSVTLLKKMNPFTMNPFLLSF